jgi:hypothetical protein
MLSSNVRYAIKRSRFSGGVKDLARVVGCFGGGLCGRPLEKQIPRARKKALGMTR